MRWTTELSSAICSARCWLCFSERRRASLARSSSRAFCAACSTCSWVSSSRRWPSSSLARSRPSRRRAASSARASTASASPVPVRRRHQRRQAAAVQHARGPGRATAGSIPRARAPRPRAPPPPAAPPLRRGPGGTTSRPARARTTRAGRRERARATSPREREPRLQDARRAAACRRGTASAAGRQRRHRRSPSAHVRDAAGERLPAHLREAGLLQERAELRRRREARHRGGQVGVGPAVAADPASQPRQDEARSRRGTGRP